MQARRDLAGLELRLGHRFEDRGKLEQALLHVSAAKGPEPRLASYQRLEFLGDRVLGLIVSEMLCEAFPRAEEGELSVRLAELVRRETCAEIAIGWDVGPSIRLGAGEAQSGGRRKAAILGDVCEALIGAVFLDAGFAAAREVVRCAWADRLERPAAGRRDAKTRLQEWAQAQGLPVPVYREVSRSGPEHSLAFVIAVAIEGAGSAEGGGRSKRDAEQAAARMLLDSLTEVNAA